jgi:hypothetical protein
MITICCNTTAILIDVRLFSQNLTVSIVARFYSEWKSEKKTVTIKKVYRFEMEERMKENLSFRI